VGIPYQRRKARPHRQWRERKHYFGEMQQIDGSHHDWFEGRGPACVLMGYIDDATGNVFARFYAYAGKKNPALKWLRKSFEERDPHLINLGVSRDWDNLRDDPRFQDLLQQMNLPDEK